MLELAARLGADHVNLQPNVRPYRLQECIPYLEGWRRLADQAGIAVHVETYRDRMTTDLFLHPAIARLLSRPAADRRHLAPSGRSRIRVAGRCGQSRADPSHPRQQLGIHGRIASREQAQISLGFPQHQGWAELFMVWWEYAIRSWRKRAG